MLKKLLVAILILSFGCQKNNDLVYDVPPEFEPFVQRFITEAAARGHQISIDNLIIKYQLSASTTFCATSNLITTANDVQKIILIKSLDCWQNDAQLESLIFHELGHCILGREHDKTMMPKGDPKSIMYPANITMYSPCVYPLGTPCDLLYRRDYYLDELFDPFTTPLPDWGK